MIPDIISDRPDRSSVPSCFQEDRFQIIPSITRGAICILILKIATVQVKNTRTLLYKSDKGKLNLTVQSMVFHKQVKLFKYSNFKYANLIFENFGNFGNLDGENPKCQNLSRDIGVLKHVCHLTVPNSNWSENYKKIL